MSIINLCEKLFNNNVDFDNIKNELISYFDSEEILNEIYFRAKKINKNVLEERLRDDQYLIKVMNTIKKYSKCNLIETIQNQMNEFEVDMKYKLGDEKIYLIFGLDTTTIYSTEYNGEKVTVLLLESTNGDLDNLNILLAHEFTHFIRKDILNKDIFGESIGERFITEGIASNYSREIVPNKGKEDYCIVPKSTILWVDDNINFIEELIKNEIDNNKLMELFFYMYADINEMPVRTGYVYGYLKVYDYLKRHNLRVSDIIDIDWRKIIYN